MTLTDWRWPNFTPHEMACRCGCGVLGIEPEFMDRLQDLRRGWGKPLVVTSGFRCQKHPVEAKKPSKDGPHTTGRAADLAVAGEDILKLTALAIAFEFTGVGWKQHGPFGGRFIHLDDLPPGPNRPRPHGWSYP